MHVVLTGNTTFKLANFRQGLIRHFISQGHRVTVLAPPDDYVEAIKDMGCGFAPVVMDRNGTSPLTEACLAFSIARNLRCLRPDVVLGYTIKNNIYGGISCRLLGIPFVPNVTGLGPAFNKDGLLNKVVKGLYKIAFRKACRVFFQNTSDLRTFLEAKLVDPGRTELLPGSGVDLELFGATPMPETENGVRFLLVARMLWDKGVGVFVQAAEKVRERHPEARFQLLGPTDPDSCSGVSLAQIDEWVADGTVEYLGTTKHVLPFLKQAHCIVLPSHYREGTPRSLLEAGAVGRPIITTDMPGCRDLVEGNANGFLVRPRNPDELAAACEAFLALERAHQVAQGAASRRLVERRYDEQFVIGAYVATLDGITAED